MYLCDHCLLNKKELNQAPLLYFFLNPKTVGNKACGIDLPAGVIRKITPAGDEEKKIYEVSEVRHRSPNFGQQGFFKKRCPGNKPLALMV